MSQISLDFYCYKCDSYFILRDIKDPSCEFCHDSFVVSSKEHEILEFDDNEYDEIDEDYYKVGKYPRSRNERYIGKATAYNNNLTNLGSKVYLTHNSNMNRLFQSQAEISNSPFKPITNEQMDSLPTVEMCSSGVSCSICFMEFSESIDIVKSLYCGHQFHKTCLKSWLCQKLECPTCRHLVSFQTNTNKRSFSSIVIDGTRSNCNESSAFVTNFGIDAEEK